MRSGRRGPPCAPRPQLPKWRWYGSTSSDYEQGIQESESPSGYVGGYSGLEERKDYDSLGECDEKENSMCSERQEAKNRSGRCLLGRGVGQIVGSKIEDEGAGRCSLGQSVYTAELT